MTEATVQLVVAHAAPTIAALAALVASVRGRRHTKAQLHEIHTIVNGERAALLAENDALRRTLAEHH